MSTFFSLNLLDLVFPCNCVSCGGLPESEHWRYVCGTCVGRLEWVGTEYCRRCGYPYAGGPGRGSVCAKCRELEPYFDAGRSLFLHRGPGGALVRALKYRGALYLRADLLNLVAAVPDLREYVQGATLVPVPLYALRERERGFNQACFLAGIVAEACGAHGVEELLLRIRNTGTQTQLSREERMANVKKAFAIRDTAHVKEGHTYIIVDDVYTTGATLNACAEQLFRAGATDIRVLTLAHG